jgi:hypothetical protein
MNDSPLPPSLMDFQYKFGLMVTYLGGPGESIQLMRKLAEEHSPHGCYSKVEAGKFYMDTIWGLRNMLFTRVFIIIISVICSYLDRPLGLKITKIIAAVLVVYAFTHMLSFCKCKI